MVWVLGGCALGLAVSACRSKATSAPAASSAPSAAAGPPPASEASDSRDTRLALLGGLKAGDQLGAAVVVSVGPVRRGRLAIEVSVEGSTGVLELLLRDDNGPEPIAITERYAIFWRTADLGTNHLTAEALEDVATDLGRVVAAHERSAPVPRGLTKFVEEKRVGPPGQQQL